MKKDNINIHVSASRIKEIRESFKLTMRELASKFNTSSSAISNYEMEEFDERNTQLLLGKLGLNINNYLIAMTRPSFLTVGLIGHIAEFANRYCIISFSETELNIIMLSRINSKKVTELVKIPRSEINNLKFTNILVSFMLKLKVGENKLIFQVFKKVGKFKNIKESINLFKKIYNV